MPKPFSTLPQLLFCLLCCCTLTLSAQQLRLSTNYKGGVNYVFQQHALEKYGIAQQHSLGIQLQYRPFPKANLHLLTGIALTTSILPFKEALIIPDDDGNGGTRSSGGPFSDTKTHVLQHLSIPIFLMRKNEKNSGIYGGLELNKFLWTSKVQTERLRLLNIKEPWDAPESFYINGVLGYHWDIKNQFQLSVEANFSLSKLGYSQHFGSDTSYHLVGLRLGFGYYFWKK